ncbi:MAG TPA: phosphodiesterase [Solirubrobacterales bacterium]
MAKPILLAQLSDLHIGGNENGVDPVPRLEATIEAVRSLPNPVDAVLVSGDLTDDGAEAGYLLARDLLGRFDVPVHVFPGNHDDRGRIREAFDLPGSGAEPVNYSTDVSELRLVVLDSNVPGQDPGAFPAERLEWLDTELGAEPDRPTLLALHHTPLATGNADWDAINLLASDREALAAVVARHRQLRAIAGGHLHRVAASALAGCPVLSAPSAYLQALPDFEADDVEFGGSPGFALHVFSDGELSSQVQSVLL